MATTTCSTINNQSVLYIVSEAKLSIKFNEKIKIKITYI